jgi:RNA polymerase sigma-70 factor (ECF subfamily)
MAFSTDRAGPLGRLALEPAAAASYAGFLFHVAAPVGGPDGGLPVTAAAGQPASPRPSVLAPEDARLIAACLAAEAGAWETFVERFAGLFYRVVDRTAFRRRTGISAADRDDLVAEILLACLHHDAAVLRGFAGRASLPTYLTVIARRVVARALVRLAETGRLAAQAIVADPAAATPDPATAVADREQVESLLARLDEREAKLLRLHHLEARSYGEISRLTGMPLGSIGPALSRAKAKLRLLREAG